MLDPRGFGWPNRFCNMFKSGRTCPQSPNCAGCLPGPQCNPTDLEVRSGPRGPVRGTSRSRPGPRVSDSGTRVHCANSFDNSINSRWGQRRHHRRRCQSSLAPTTGAMTRSMPQASQLHVACRKSRNARPRPAGPCLLSTPTFQTTHLWAWK